MPDQYYDLRGKCDRKLAELEALKTEIEAKKTELVRAQQAWDNFAEFLVGYGVDPTTLTIENFAATRADHSPIPGHNYLPNSPYPFKAGQHSSYPFEVANEDDCDDDDDDADYGDEDQMNLPDIDSPTLEEEMTEILKSDKKQTANLCLLIESFDWHEKMAIGLIAYHQIDPTHTQLIKLTPAHGEFSIPLKQAIEFVKKLSPQALAELAAGILSEDFEIRDLGSVDDDDDDDDIEVIDNAKN